MQRASVGSRQLGVATLALVSVIAAAAPPIVAAAEVPSPIIEGPVTGGGEPFIASTTFDLAEVGYEQAEYFISGTASGFDFPQSPAEFAMIRSMPAISIMSTARSGVHLVIG